MCLYTCNCRRTCSIVLDVSFLMERPASQGSLPIGIYRILRGRKGCQTSHWPKFEERQRNLAFTVVDEAQQFGTDREVTATAMLPPTSFVLWTGDAQQTPGGIAKGHNQYARSRQQLMSRRHALRCPQTEWIPHNQRLCF